ncbi:MAG: type IV pilus twitching motility protein PilT [Deltaproteobacteria bacterium]|nr:type IV pilus twitching motility protein PilT [Deltaproteobacteria bacterium]
MELNEILTVALKGGASDIHLKAGLPPIFRIDGSLVPLKDAPRLPPEEVARMALGIMNNYQKDKFKEDNEIDLAYGVPGLGRFRVNVFMQRGAVGVVLRVIPFKILTIEQLMLPKVLEKIALEERGLILVTGTTGSGKSTTLAAMIDHINTNETCHILTVEDPIEFLIRDKRSIVNQREVGVDTRSFARALKSALREDPDVILVGEMRDLETIEMGLTAAETGHLVLSTLHTLDATESIARVVNVFPPYQQKQVRLALAAILKAIISQRLVPRADGRGRLAALEVMVSTARVRELIEDKDRTKEIHDAIAQGNVSYGMQTFDQALMAHLHKGVITYEEALRQSTNPDDFALKVSGVSGTSDTTWGDVGASAKPQGAPQQQQAPAAPAYARPAAPANVPPPYAQAPRPGIPAGAPPPYVTPAAGMRAPAIPPPAGAPVPGRPMSQPAIPPPAGSAQQPAKNPDDDFQIERF